MTDQTEDLFIDLNPEELKKLSKILADTLVEQYAKTLPPNTQAITCVSVSGAILPEQQALETIQLDLIASAVAGWTDPIGQLWNSITSFFSSVADTIISSISGFINEHVIPAINSVGGAITGFINAILKFPEWFPKWFMDNIASPISKSISAIGTAIWNALPDWLKNALTAISNFFTQSVVTFFSQTLPSFFDWFAKGLQAFFKDPLGWIKTNLIDPLYNSVVKPLIDFFTKTIPEFFTQTLPDWFMNQFVPTVMGGLQAIWNFLSDIANFIWQGLQTIADLILKAISGLAAFIGNAIVNAFSTISKAIMSALTTTFKAVEDFFRSLYGGMQSLTAQVGRLFFAPFILEHIKALGLSTPEFFSKDYVEEQTEWLMLFNMGALLVPLFGQIPLRLLAWLGRSIGHWFEGLSFPLTIYLDPFGIGASVEFDLAKAFGASLTTSAEEVEKYAFEIGRGLIYGYAIWAFRPLASIVNLMLRNIIPIRTPREDLIVEYVRRALPRNDIEEILKISKFYMEIQGYSDWILDKYFESPDKYNIKVTDRFGIKRTVPLALIYQLPSASDVATMMVRDVFASFEDFQELYQARGMHPDIGALYYFLRFRYPPPERLWQFTTRGISGLLWATLPDTEKTAIQAEAKPLGAYMPTAPADLNFKADQLISAFKTYMKWHDYAKFAWVKDFASDNLIYIDTLADIPTKIDQRWLVKWGIYEFLSAKKVTYQSPIWDFNVKTIEPKATSNITLDLTNFCRTLQATGLHPDWVPVTAVAETMNVLSEERTLLRTGVISLFKEGFLDTDAIETFLAGAITTSFQVAYFDMDALQWTTGWLNIPVMFLPPERKLIELRAIMDRALDILRDIQKDAFTAYQEYIIWDKNEFESKLSDIIDEINAIYAQDYKAITGKDLPDTLKLTYVKAYYDSYLEALKIWREVFTVRRIRMWTQRWLGWVMYRVAYGQVSPEDIDKLVSVIKEKAKLTDTEADFIDQVASIMYGIAKRTTVAEYLPTPQTMATLSEYMTLDTSLVKKVLTERGLDETWQKIWLTYITVKPIKADAKALLSTYVRALRYQAIDQKTLDDYIKTLQNYGFTDKEIELIRKSIDLEEQIIEARLNKQEYVPTLSTIATMLEYVSIPADQIQKVFEARNVPEEWQDIWNQYYSIRPIADDVRVLTDAYYRAKRYQIPLNEIEKQVTDILKASGMTDQELNIRNLATQIQTTIDEYLENRREYIPTPSMLATLAEYVVITEDHMNKVYTARNVPQEWRDVWTQYINARPIADDVKALLSAYRRTSLYIAIPDDITKKVMDYAKIIGFTDRELAILELRNQLEEMLIEYKESRREYIPTPSTLATLAEYVVISQDHITKVFNARNVPQEWQEVWKRYITARPLADDIKALISTYRRALLYVSVPDDITNKVKDYAKIINFGDTEFAILDLRNQLEEMILQSREYIPTPASLATIVEIIPEARAFFYDVVKARRIPKQWQAVWAKYIDYKPIIDEVKKMLSRVESLYEYFAIDEATYKKVLNSVKYLGWTDQEIEFMLYTSRYVRWLRAYRELIGDIDRMVTISNYSPKAEEYALGNLYKMIDAMPIDPATKQTLKAMWEDYIRNRHVKDEVITYVRDLVNLYVYGQLSYTDLDKELTWLEQWGLSKYEHQFWLMIADARKARKLGIPVAFTPE